MCVSVVDLQMLQFEFLLVQLQFLLSNLLLNAMLVLLHYRVIYSYDTVASYYNKVKVIGEDEQVKRVWNDDYNCMG